MDVFSFAQCVRVAQLISGFLLEGTAPCVVIYLVCPWEEPPISLGLKTASFHVFSVSGEL